ncbi:heme o synthase [Curvivirga aplysinae]|uniref:heme o synthase n=1 Tax=Curvivirga aplysinae TaxID=2529852 RepID=UPI0012BBAC64|nr:heme o synthase [Curvivirga aplysinae]MTI11337.1 protoheme IX farnesyltransferase [Curvivirga aplysinae]
MSDTALDITETKENDATDYVARAGHYPAEVKDYVALLKPRVMSLVVFSGMAGLLVAPGEMHPLLAAVAILCIAVGSGAAGAINMWYDRDIDLVMARTKERPIPAGKMNPDEALSFGVVLSFASVFLMAVAVNYAAAALLAGAILFYVFIYTMWLKRSTPQNIVIGGAAGAFPPMIGWAAVTGDVSWEPIVLFSLIFLWTPPHFWALALFRCKDYAKAGVPMLPVVSGEEATKKQMLFYTLTLFPIAAAPTFLGFAGWIYFTVSLALNLVFLAAAVAVMREDGEKTEYKQAKRMFGFSILYLFMLFAVLVMDSPNTLWG